MRPLPLLFSTVNLGLGNGYDGSEHLVQGFVE